MNSTADPVEMLGHLAAMKMAPEIAHAPIEEAVGIGFDRLISCTLEGRAFADNSVGDFVAGLDVLGL